MDAIRLATDSEVQSIATRSDLDVRVPAQAVAFGDANPDFAVVKQVFEMDPVIFAESTSDKRKALFMWSMMNHLRLNGIPVVYFNIAADDARWQAVAQNFGVEQISPVAELRFKMTLIKDQSVNQENNGQLAKAE